MRLIGPAALAAALVLALPAQSANRLQPVPILMYHVVTSAPANAPYPELYVPAAARCSDTCRGRTSLRRLGGSRDTATTR